MSGPPMLWQSPKRSSRPHNEAMKHAIEDELCVCGTCLAHFPARRVLLIRRCDQMRKRLEIYAVE